MPITGLGVVVNRQRPKQPLSDPRLRNPRKGAQCISTSLVIFIIISQSVLYNHELIQIKSRDIKGKISRKKSGGGEKFEEKKGRISKKKNIIPLCTCVCVCDYADDQNLISDDVGIIERDADMLLNACKDIGLAVNTGKTKYMELGCRRDIMANEHIAVGITAYEKRELLNN